MPMIWLEPVSHLECYFCTTSVNGYNGKNKKHITYSTVSSAIKPIPNDSDLLIPEPFNVMESPDSDIEMQYGHEEVYDSESSNDSVPHKFEQAELNDLTRDLNLSKEAAQLLGSRLNSKNLLSSDTTFAWYRHREKEYTIYFLEDESLVYCVDIPGLITHLGAEHYDPNDWRLFIDSNKISLKAILLHNGNKFSSVPVAHSVHIKNTLHWTKRE